MILALILSLILPVFVVGTPAPADAQTITATANKCSKNQTTAGSPSIFCTLPGSTCTTCMIAVCVLWDNATQGTLASITDNAGLGASYTRRTATWATLESLSQMIGDSINYPGVSASISITANFSPNVTNAAIYVQEFTNVATSGHDIDKVTTSTGGTTATDNITTGASGTRTQANELIFGCVNATNVSANFTQGTGYTVSKQEASWGASEYKVVSATGTDAATWTSNVAVHYIASLATYKDVVAGGGGGGAAAPTRRRQ